MRLFKRNLIFGMFWPAILGFAHPSGETAAAPGANAALNMAQQQTIEGSIAAIQIAFGLEFPSITVNQKQIKVAPAWFLLENDFTLSLGDVVKVAAAPTYRAPDAYFYAIEIIRIGAGKRIVLRNAAGIPLWTGGRQGGPAAPGAGSACVDSTGIRTVSGVVDRVALGVGITHPTLTLKVENTLLTLQLGPERILAASGMELTPGAELTVKYAPSLCSDLYFALQITASDGNTVELRQDDGTPAWPRPAWPRH